MLLYHYFEREKGPLLSLTDMDSKKARRLLEEIKERGGTLAADRPQGYLERRRELERLVRETFVSKGGKPARRTPHYFVVESCPWLESWYTDAAFIKIPFSALDSAAVSFTYGDMFPTFSPHVQDGKEYRNAVYTHAEILAVIEKHGLPQDWNPDGSRGPERYVEAQVWCDIPPVLCGR